MLDGLMTLTSHRTLATLALAMLFGPLGCCLTPAAENHDGGGTSGGGTSGGCSPPCVAAAGLTCVGGKCVCESSALSPCPTASGGQKCTDLQVDPNCGACGKVCDAASGEICRDGKCICGVAGYGFCPDARGSKTCRNLQSDTSNCGMCARVCDPGKNCISGNCR